MKNIGMKIAPNAYTYHHFNYNLEDLNTYIYQMQAAHLQVYCWSLLNLGQNESSYACNSPKRKKMMALYLTSRSREISYLWGKKSAHFCIINACLPYQSQSRCFVVFSKYHNLEPQSKVLKVS